MPFAENYEGFKNLLPSVCTTVDKTVIIQIEYLSEMLKNSLNILSSPKITLTPREIEIVELVRQGLSNKEIAAELYISISTVKTLLGRIYEKTGVSTKTQLVMLDL
jgi:LuxR family maltose regulon positive regulatory protein